MRLHAELVTKYRHWRSLRSIGLGLAPERVRLARLRRPGPALPHDLAEEAEAWLTPYRHGWLE
jgi:hypothetical protein